MFDGLLPEPAALSELDDTALIAAVSGWARAAAAAEARKLAATAELARRRCTGAHADWACDDVDAAAAEIAAALNIGHGRACAQLDLAVTLRDRLPKVGALLAAGDITARTAAVIAHRTDLVTDKTALARLDHTIAERAVTYGPLSEYKLTQALDVWVDRIDPAALRHTRSAARGREVLIGSPRDGDGITSVAGRLHTTDAALFDQRLTAMARGVCADDPRTLAQRRADAVGALGAGSTHLACLCGSPACPAATEDGRATSIVVHVIAEQDTLTAEPDPAANGDDRDEPEPLPQPKAALIPAAGGGIVPAPLLAELIARGATVTPVTIPGGVPEPRYRPSAALDRFIRTRDLTCRFPGCDRPAAAADIDHTTPYPAGPTHPSNAKNYCRKHHLLKSFWPGWSDRQLPDGTLLVTTPSGHTYTTKPGSMLLFPAWNVATAPLPHPGTPPPPSQRRTLMMPTRKTTRAKARAYRIKAERALNDAHVAERNIPPPF